jgi:hypothetical protein
VTDTNPRSKQLASPGGLKCEGEYVSPRFAVRIERARAVTTAMRTPSKVARSTSRKLVDSSMRATAVGLRLSTNTTSKGIVVMGIVNRDA